MTHGNTLCPGPTNRKGEHVVTSATSTNHDEPDTPRFSSHRLGSPTTARTPALPPHTRRPTPLPLADSPRIIALTDAVRAGTPDATTEFWARVHAETTPLVEPDPHSVDHRIVTFLWRSPQREDQQPADVLLHANKLTDYNDPAPTLLRRVDGTDVWHVSYRMRSDWRGTYALGPCAEPVRLPRVWSGPDRADWRRLRETAVPDPLNPSTFPNKFGDRPLSLVELPDAPGQPWCGRAPAGHRGELVRSSVRSDILDNERDVWTYFPVGYRDNGGPYPLLIVFDGDVWAHDPPLRNTLDNLIAAGEIPPMLALLVDSIDPGTRAVELACDERFFWFLTTELVPFAHRRWPLVCDPRRRVLAGQSLGGLTAAFAATRAPDWFGNVLSQSGSFWWPGGSELDDDAEWLTRQLAAQPRLPIAFDLEVGLLEWELLAPTRHLRSVLTAREYPFSYREYHGGHDPACWRGGIAEGLRALTARWRSEPGGVPTRHSHSPHPTL